MRRFDAHDFRDQDAPAADLRGEALADHVAQGIREPLADLLLLVIGEHADDAVDRLRRR